MHSRYDATSSGHAALEKGKNDARYPGKDRRYKAVDSSDLPLTESLKQTIQRVLPYWSSNVLPAVQAGKRCIIVGHGNSIRVSLIGPAIWPHGAFTCQGLSAPLLAHMSQASAKEHSLAGMAEMHHDHEHYHTLQP